MASSEIIISPGQHLTGITTTYTVAIFIPMAVIVMSLRLHARKAHGLSISADDKLCIVSLVVFTAYCAGALVCVCTYGAGQSYTDLEETELKSRQYLQARSIGGGRSSSQLQFWTFGIFDLALDAVMLFLLVPRFILLQVGGLRVQLALAIFFGSIVISAETDSVIMTGTVRVAYGCITDDFLGDYDQVTQWSVMQLVFAVMCTCMPCLITGLLVNEANGGDRLVWFVLRLPERPNSIEMPTQSRTPAHGHTDVPFDDHSS
ncbi:hypothetical protein BO99DRAFT_460593 [Aspergillus violaceofuscus CBS 115571]|uniref:Integral membrane protein n=1 Tax=Aspergillus violaceofuscus (strain CBS 115571) TaxID=1450538 RepID=A0A2V5H503_ASPV1|nr:hypothetical protein BO99DRAFT_460593 [Aspergillus violaceofuscus CBS 115571]